MDKKNSTLDEYVVIKSLGKGASAKVKLVEDAEGKKFAAKIMVPTAPYQVEKFRAMANNEVAMMKQVDHPNVVKVFKTSENGLYCKKTGQVTKVMYVLMEFCEGGEVFEFLFQTGKFPEETARFYFKQLLDGVEAVHSKGITHRDLKPENLLFDRNFNLKITDFGYAKYLSGEDGSGILKTHLGTEAYMAPEIHEYKGYSGTQVDMFAVAMVLFIFKS